MHREQTTQERAFATMSYMAFPKKVRSIGFWETDEQIIELAGAGFGAEGTSAMLAGANCFFAAFGAHDPLLVSTSDEQVFYSLVKKWQEESDILSSTNEIVMCPAYQSIMSMGPQVVPYILKQLEREGDQPRNWFWALRHITRQNPVPPAQRGNRRAMAQAWLAWARYRYVW
jgi:hypothetical protein